MSEPRDDGSCIVVTVKLVSKDPVLATQPDVEGGFATIQAVCLSRFSCTIGSLRLMLMDLLPGFGVDEEEKKVDESDGFQINQGIRLRLHLH